MCQKNTSIIAQGSEAIKSLLLQTKGAKETTTKKKISPVYYKIGVNYGSLTSAPLLYAFM